MIYIYIYTISISVETGVYDAKTTQKGVTFKGHLSWGGGMTKCKK